MRTTWDDRKVLTVAQVFIFKWRFSCRCRHYCGSFLILRKSRVLENEIYRDKFFYFFFLLTFVQFQLDIKNHWNLFFVKCLKILGWKNAKLFVVYNLKLQITRAQTRIETKYQTFRGQKSYYLVLKLVFGSKALNKLGSSALQRKFYVNETNCAVSINHYKYSLGIILSPCSFQLTLVFSLLYKNAPLFE